MSGVDVITFGCRLNTYESEVMRSEAEKAGLNNAILVGDRSNEQAAKRPEGATVVKPRPPKTWKGEDAPADEQGQPQGSNGKGTTGNNGNGKGKLQGW